MHQLAWLLLVVVAASSAQPQCTAADATVWRNDAEGASWEHEFRALGGLWVSRSSYEEAVVRLKGLTPACASCYGAAYECGYNDCKWSCAFEGVGCTSCLNEAGCIAACNRCTGFK